MNKITPVSDALVIAEGRDNVAVVFRTIEAGESLRIKCGGESLSLSARTAVPTYHKIALSDFSPGDPVYKYGEQIGCAILPIAAGEHVHDHNMASALATVN